MPRHDSLNYAAKWDRILVDSSDEESSSTGERPRRPRVTRLDQPSTITITPRAGAVAAEKRTDETGTKNSNNNHNQQEDEVPTEAPQNQISSTSTSPSVVPLFWTERGAAVILDPSLHNSNNNKKNDPPTTKNAALATAPATDGCSGYYWTQDRDTVTIRIPIPHHDKEPYSWNCTVQSILSYPDRHCAILSQQPTLVVEYYHRERGRPSDSTNTSVPVEASSTTTSYLQGTLSRPVHLAHDEDTIDWTIEEEPSVSSSSTYSSRLRYLCVTLSKATPMPGLTLWWTQCLPQYEPQEIPLTSTTTHNNSNAQAWSEAWEQAHAQFRAKIRTRAEPHSIT